MMVQTLSSKRITRCGRSNDHINSFFISELQFDTQEGGQFLATAYGRNNNTGLDALLFIQGDGCPLFPVSPFVSFSVDPTFGAFGNGDLGGGTPAIGLTTNLTLTDSPSLTAAVPEPSTWAMILTGFVGLMGFATYSRKEGYHRRQIDAGDLAIGLRAGE